MFIKLNSLFVFIILFYIIGNCEIGKSQIVTPGRLSNNDKKHGPIRNNTKVQVTDKNLKEAKALRDEISSAVQENRYHVILEHDKKLENSNISINKSDKTNPTNKEILKPIAKPNETLLSKPTPTQNHSDATNVAENSDTKNHLNSGISGDEISPEFKNSAGNSDLEETIEKEINNLDNNKKSNSSGIKANVVHSQLASTDEEHRQRFLLEDFLPKHFADREVLTVTSIEEDPKFILGDGVREWKILRTEDQNYWIGLKAHHILIISDAKYEDAIRVDFGYPIESIETFSFWNTTSDRSIGVILISIGNSISWIESKSLELIWTWNIGKKSKNMKFYQIDGREYVAILAVTENSKQYSINIYEFIEETKEFWIIQMIPLKHATDEMIFLDTGREAVLAVTQGKDVLVYDYNPDAEFRYELAEKFTSEDLKSITAFKMGGYSYLAISGREAKILRYYRGDFVPQTLFGGYFKLVHMYFPVPARTYRDDLILLVQHSMEFEGHSLMVLEALVWNGQSFEASGDIPCTMGNETFNFGVSCMIDLERESGIAGAAIIDGGRNISIIVPREDAPSGVFTINTVLKERKTESQELEELYKFLNSTVMDQETIIEEAENFIKKSDDNLTDLDLDYFSATELYFDGEIDEIFINDIKWTEEDEDFHIDLLLKDIEELTDDIKNLEMHFAEDDPNLGIGRKEDENVDDCLDPKPKTKRSINKFDYSNLVLNNVIIDNLIVDFINNKSIPKLIKDGILNFNGTIIFENGLIVKDKSNLSKNETQHRAFGRDDETLEIDELTIDGDIEFDFINGIRWTEFLSKVTLITFPATFDTLIVEGDVIVDQGLQIDSINGIEYPYGFLWSSGPRTNVITAKKNFTGLLESNAMDTAGLINGIDPFTFVTLSTDQTITGKTTFKQLEVSERLELNGTVSGRGLQDFLSNPTLLETTIINSACRFNVLTVNGTIKILNKFNDHDLDEILEDIVYKEDGPIEIKANKYFSQGIEFVEDVVITSNSINDILIKDFITKNTDQELEITNFIGDIEFENLWLEGYFNSINITDLFENALFFDSDNFIDTTFIIENPELLKISELIVLNSLNDESLDTLLNINENMEFDELRIDDVLAHLVESNVDIDGPEKKFNGIDIKNLSQINVQINGVKNDSNEMFINELIVENDLNLDFLNGYEVVKAIQILEKVHDIPYMVKQGLVTVRELIVNGNIKINTINGKHFDEEILSRVIWLNRENHIINPILFKDSINFEDGLKIDGLLNDESFQTLINDIIWKECPDLLKASKSQLSYIKSQKTFMHPIVIKNNADIEYLNQGLTKNLAKTNTNCSFQGNLYIYGDLDVTNLYVGQSFNDIESEIFTDLCQFDSNLDSYVIGGEVYINGKTTIDNLQIIGNLNEYENCSNFINNLIYRNESAIVESEIIFEKSLQFKNNIYIEILNGKNISNAFKNIVYDNENDIVEIHSPVIFKESVTLDSLEIQNELYTTNLGGCDLNEWKMNAIPLDEEINIPKLYFSSGCLDSNALKVSYLNEYDLSNLITLHSPQNFSTNNIHFSELFLTGSITSLNLINERWDIKAEMENTLMKNKKTQRITSPITAKSFKILDNLHIDALVNEKKNISDVVHLLSPTIEIYSPVFFKNLTVSKVFTKDFISGFNFNQWYDESLWSKGRPEQTVTGNWNIKNLYVKEQIAGNHNINEIPLDMIRGQLDGPSEDQQKQFKHMADNYNILCQKVQKLVKKAQNRIYFVKYFEKTAKYREYGLINSINIFNHKGSYYLLSNVDCHTNIYQWNMKDSQFIQINRFESGLLIEFLPVMNKNKDLNLMINSKDSELLKCKNKGLYNWKFNDGNISGHGQFFGYYDSIHHDSNDNGVIYGIPVNQNAVIKMDMNSNKTEQNQIWELPAESNGLYRFLPENTEFGTAVSDGKRILIVNKNFKFESRKKRNIDDKEMVDKVGKNMNVTIESVKNDLKNVIQNLIKNITESLEIIEQSNINDNITYQIATSNYSKIILQIQDRRILDNFNFTSYLVLNKSHFDNLTLIAFNITRYCWSSINKIEEIQNMTKEHQKILDQLLIQQTHGYLETLKVFNQKLIKGIATGIINIADVSIQNTTHLNESISNTKQQHLKQVLNNLINFLMIRLEFLKPINNTNNLNSKDEIKLKPSTISARGIQFTPSIRKTIPQRQHANTTNPLFNRKSLEEYFHEPIVGRDISSGSSNLLIADNTHIPDKVSGEILTIKVSFKENRRTLFVVINSKNYDLRGAAGSPDDVKDFIKIFFDVMQGHIFQTIQADNPRNLAVLNIRDETVLGYVEGKNIIKLYIYRGIQGFVEFAHIQVEHKVEILLSVPLPKKDSHKVSTCPEFYFIAAGENYFSFYKAILAGTCTVEGDLKCGNWA